MGCSDSQKLDLIVIFWRLHGLLLPTRRPFAPASLLPSTPPPPCSNHMSPTSISQKILPDKPESIPIRTFSRRLAGSAAMTIRRSSEENGCLGLAMKRLATGRVAILAVATVLEVVIISVDAGKSADMLLYDKPFQELLCDETCTLAGFDMARLAIRISDDLKLQVRALDLSTAFVADTRKPSRPSQVIEERVYRNVDKAAVDSLWNDDTENSDREVCLRAWLSACVAERSTDALSKVSRVDTRILNSQEIRCLGEMIRQTYVLEDAIPKETPSEFNRFQVTEDGTLKLQNARYKTRVRKSRQTVIMTNESGHEFLGETRGAKGRMTDIRFTGQALSGTLHKVRVVGRPELTNPEKAREELLLLLLQGKASLQTLFIRKLWFPGRRACVSTDDVEFINMPGLNPSQEKVASQMVSGSSLVVTHGPPGTGKTTTIAAAAVIWDRLDLPTWIIAHSNVAVKNIAETLFKKGVDFKILVSKEFHFEWHEHIYNLIQQKVLVSDDFLGITDVAGTARLLGGSCIMLSTLSMLSNPTVDRVGVFRVVPVERLVVDEASQIKIEDFMPIFHKFRRTLEKVCFFGDPNQLPPYGKEKVPELRTIFDVEHLKGSAGFLNTQYRMPVPLGSFISRYVYDGKLKSEHRTVDPSCVVFVDTRNGGETKSGFSWTNSEEIQTIVNLVKTYYKNKNFCVITPYDAQRAAIERQLKAEELPWDRVFNVDSFQGNEADFVLVSVVRSGHQPGFLTSLNRMNVLLTRCRRGLVIVTSRWFLRDGGTHTLLGRLERYWMDLRGESAWVDWKSVLEGKADLPEAFGPNRERSGTLFRRVPGAPSYYSAVPATPQKRFDTKSLFRPRPPQVKTLAPLLPVETASLWSSNTSRSFSRPPSASTETPTSPNPLFSGGSYNFVNVPTTFSSRTTHITPRFPEYTPTNYEADFPRLSIVDVPHTQSLSTQKLAPDSLLLKGNQNVRDKTVPASANAEALNPMSLRKLGGTVGTQSHSQALPMIRRLEISQQQIARTRLAPSTTTKDTKLQPKGVVQIGQGRPKAHSVPSSKPPHSQSYRAKPKSPPTSTGHFSHPAPRDAQRRNPNGMSVAQPVRADADLCENRFEGGGRRTREKNKYMKPVSV